MFSPPPKKKKSNLYFLGCKLYFPRNFGTKYRKTVLHGMHEFWSRDNISFFVDNILFITFDVSYILNTLG